MAIFRFRMFFLPGMGPRRLVLTGGVGPQPSKNITFLPFPPPEAGCGTSAFFFEAAFRPLAHCRLDPTDFNIPGPILGWPHDQSPSSYPQKLQTHKTLKNFQNSFWTKRKTLGTGRLLHGDLFPEVEKLF